VPSTSAARRMSAFCSEVRRIATRSVLVATNELCAYRAYRSIQADALHRPRYWRMRHRPAELNPGARCC
jgi:hypothetical protein